MKHLILLTALSSSLVSCTPEVTQADDFFDRISPYCGNAYAGKLVSTDEVDADFAAESITMHVRDCSTDEVRIPLHVGDNRSRTWIVSKTDSGLRLKHDHRHDDGESDAITMYGGDTMTEATWANGTYVFPVDEFSKAMFDEENIPDSKQNTWVMEIVNEEELFAYQMSRPNRFFRIEFDLSKPVETPPAAWGYK